MTAIPSLQQAIASKLKEFNFIASADIVCEFTLMMIANNKTLDQIESELSEFEIPKEFIDWLKQYTSTPQNQNADAMAIDVKLNANRLLRTAIKQVIHEPSFGSGIIKKKTVSMDSVSEVIESSTQKKVLEPYETPKQTTGSNVFGSKPTTDVFSRLGKKVERNTRSSHEERKERDYSRRNKSRERDYTRRDPSRDTRDTDYPHRNKSREPYSPYATSSTIGKKEDNRLRIRGAATRTSASNTVNPNAIEFVVQKPVETVPQKDNFYQKPSFKPVENFGMNNSSRPSTECKFGRKCLRADCTFSHPSPASIVNTLPGTTPTSYTPLSATTSQIQCRFFPHCLNPQCTFYHPQPQKNKSLPLNVSGVPCRFAPYCKKADCPFLHNPSQLGVSQRIFALDEVEPETIYAETNSNAMDVDDILEKNSVTSYAMNVGLDAVVRNK